MGEVTPDRRTPGVDPMGRETLEGRRGSSGLGITTLAEPEGTLGNGGCLGGPGLWAGQCQWMGGILRKVLSQKKVSPVPSSFTMPSPSALFCLSKALRSRTLRKEMVEVMRVWFLS